MYERWVKAICTSTILLLLILCFHSFHSMCPVGIPVYSIAITAAAAVFESRHVWSTLFGHICSTPVVDTASVDE